MSNTPHEGELWSFCRRLLTQGSSIYQDYAAGRYANYEELSARFDIAALENVAEIKRLAVQQSQPPSEGKP